MHFFIPFFFFFSRTYTLSDVALDIRPTILKSNKDRILFYPVSKKEQR